MQIFGNKDISLIDVWSIEHVLSGISLGHFVIKFNHDKKSDLLWILFFAFFWETIEHYLETGLAGVVIANWFYGVEYWANRIIFDPMMMILGYFIAKKLSSVVPWARLLSIIWLIVHVVFFPNSMYLNQL